MNLHTAFEIVMPVATLVLGIITWQLGRLAKREERERIAFKVEVRQMIVDMNLVTKDVLHEELDNFAARFKLKLMEELNGEAGFMRKGECAYREELQDSRHHESISQQLKEMKGKIERIERRDAEY